MPSNPDRRNRKSIRLKGYDYSKAGLYFITLCVQDRKCLFGDIVNGAMVLNAEGCMVDEAWLKLPDRFPNIRLHNYVVMPNHFHAILEIAVRATLVVAHDATNAHDGTNTHDATNAHDATNTHDKGQPQGLPLPTVGDMVGAFKSMVTVEYILGVKNLGWQPFTGKLWQRNYWEHIIRDEPSYLRISEYITNNPENWTDDKLNTHDG